LLLTIFHAAVAVRFHQIGYVTGAKMRPWSPDEPARQPEYRQLYLRTKARLESFEDVIVRMYDMITDLQKRIAELEKRNDTPRT
jgi:hypothetical protein